MVKTYALYDVVGVKEAMRSGQAEPLLERFWRTADAWANGAGNAIGPRMVQSQSHLQTPSVSVVTFSDSALLFTQPEFELAVFYEIAGQLKLALERAVGSVYCIISRGEEVVHPELPALGARIVDDQMKPAYFNVAGSGTAWVNLHLADRAIARRKDWHNRFSLYAVGSGSVPADAAALEEVPFKTIDGGDETVCALA